MIDDALNQLDGEGTVRVDLPQGEVELDVVEVGTLGVRVRSVRSTHRSAVGVGAHAERLSGRLRSLGETVKPVEVDVRLGRAILRTAPEEIRGGFFEVEVQERSVEVRRVGLREGERHRADFVLTREQLGRLVGDLQPGVEEAG